MISYCGNSDIHCAWLPGKNGGPKPGARFVPIALVVLDIGTPKLNGADDNLQCQFSSIPTPPYPCHSQR